MEGGWGRVVLGVGWGGAVILTRTRSQEDRLAGDDIRDTASQSLDGEGHLP